MALLRFTRALNSAFVDPLLVMQDIPRTMQAVKSAPASCPESSTRSFDVPAVADAAVLLSTLAPSPAQLPFSRRRALAYARTPTRPFDVPAVADAALVLLYARTITGAAVPLS